MASSITFDQFPHVAGLEKGKTVEYTTPIKGKVIGKNIKATSYNSILRKALEDFTRNFLQKVMSHRGFEAPITEMDQE